MYEKCERGHNLKTIKIFKDRLCALQSGYTGSAAVKKKKMSQTTLLPV